MNPCCELLDKGETKTLMQSLHFAKMKTAHTREGYTVEGRTSKAVNGDTTRSAAAESCRHCSGCKQEDTEPESRRMPHNIAESGKQKTARKAIK